MKEEGEFVPFTYTQSEIDLRKVHFNSNIPFRATVSEFVRQVPVPCTNDVPYFDARSFRSHQE
jgi:hypothetical protein